MSRTNLNSLHIKNKPVATKEYVDTAIPNAAIDVDATMAANSDARVASQKATKTALATKPTATLDTDTALAANSDTRVASQKAGKAYADTKAKKDLTDVVSGLPTADPHVIGKLWSNSGVVTVSAG